MGFSLKTSKWTYGPKCHSKRTAHNVIEDFIFTKPSNNSCFPYSRVVLVGIELIEGFL
jgi:hypothetical protein